ncbi:MAG: metallophosphoesterase family protein [Gemmatimonadota bacterium]
MESPPTRRDIGIISDTHGLLRPQAVEALRGTSLILHAGDVGDSRILEALREIAPVRAVYGNTDWGELRRELPRTAVVDLAAEDGEPREGMPAGPLAFMVHIREEMDLDPEAAGFSLVVTGHTHIPEIRRSGGVLYLNPGSAGPSRPGLPVTVARLTLMSGGRGGEGRSGEGAWILEPHIVELFPGT